MPKKRVGRTGRNDRRVGREVDPNLWAHRAGKASTESIEVRDPTDAEISRVMTALGRRGGKIGGKRRLETLTQEQRSQIAFKAAQARWGKKAKKP
jgi:hypothetical protein